MLTFKTRFGRPAKVLVVEEVLYEVGDCLRGAAICSGHLHPG